MKNYSKEISLSSTPELLARKQSLYNRMFTRIPLLRFKPTRTQIKEQHRFQSVRKEHKLFSSSIRRCLVELSSLRIRDPLLYAAVFDLNLQFGCICRDQLLGSKVGKSIYSLDYS